MYIPSEPSNCKRVLASPKFLTRWQNTYIVESERAEAASAGEAEKRKVGVPLRSVCSDGCEEKCLIICHGICGVFEVELAGLEVCRGRVQRKKQSGVRAKLFEMAGLP